MLFIQYDSFFLNFPGEETVQSDEAIVHGPGVNDEIDGNFPTDIAQQFRHFEINFLFFAISGRDLIVLRHHDQIQIVPFISIALRLAAE